MCGGAAEGREEKRKTVGWGPLSLPSSGAPQFVLTHRSVWAEERRQTFKRPTEKSGFAVEDFRERSWVPPDQLRIGQSLGDWGQGPLLSNLGRTQR